MIGDLLLIVSIVSLVYGISMLVFMVIQYFNDEL